MITAEQDRIYRAVLHEYNMQDARGQLEFYLGWHESEHSIEELIEMVDLDTLASMFERFQSCDTADNDTWEYTIRCYLEDHHLPVGKYD